jgi:hypothetical protein
MLTLSDHCYRPKLTLLPWLHCHALPLALDQAVQLVGMVLDGVNGVAGGSASLLLPTVAMRDHCYIGTDGLPLSCTVVSRRSVARASSGFRLQRSRTTYRTVMLYAGTAIPFLLARSETHQRTVSSIELHPMMKRSVDD